MKLTDLVKKMDQTYGKISKEFEVLADRYGEMSKLFRVLQKKVANSDILDEAMLPVVGDLEQQMAELSKRFEAARRGLGLANRLPAHMKSEHMRRIMTNMNIIRGMLARVAKSMEQFTSAEQGYEAGMGYGEENEEMGDEEMNKWLDCCPRCGSNPCNC